MRNVEGAGMGHANCERRSMLRIFAAKFHAGGGAAAVPGRQGAKLWVLCAGHMPGRREPGLEWG